MVHHRVGAEVYEVIERCRFCTNRRVRNMNSGGYWLDRWHIDYRNNYLLPKGAGRIAPALQATLRISEILSRRIEEAPE